MTNNFDPNSYDVTISALIIGLGAEKYIDIFKKHNIGQTTLMELNDEDLTKLGIDDAVIRNKIITEVKNLPLYQEQSQLTTPNIDPLEMVDILSESSQHLYRIYLSMLANTLAVKKTNNIVDCLVYKEKYASDISLTILSEMSTILNSMDISLHTQMKNITNKTLSGKKRKGIVGTVGSACIVILAVLFMRSLKQLK